MSSTKTIEEEISKAVEEGKAIIGKEQTLKKMRQGKIKKVFLAANIPQELKKEIEIISKTEGSEVIQLNIKSDQLGITAGKKFNILVLSILR